MVKLGRQEGFSLPELLIVVAIVGMIALIFPKLIVQATQSYQLHDAKIEIQRDARVSLDIMNRFLREGRAASVVIDSAASQPPFSRISFTSSAGVSTSFYQKGNQLIMANGTQTSVLSNNLCYLAFTYPRTDNTTILSVAVTMQKATYQGGNKALELSIEKVRIMD